MKLPPPINVGLRVITTSHIFDIVLGARGAIGAKTEMFFWFVTSNTSNSLERRR